MRSLDIRIPPIIAHTNRISGKHGLWFLNIAQFLTVLNDNLFKFLTIYLLIDIKGSASTNSILFWVGICYVLPFILFSTSAGVLADRFSKQRLIIWLKLFGVLAFAFAFFMYVYRIELGCYAALFLLSIQSAVLGPPKYSIIPELVRHDQISKANGLITSWSYLAMIFGTFLASFVTEITQKNFLVALTVAFVIAVLGFLASLYIPATPPQKGSEKKITPWIFKEVYDTLKACRKTPRLLISVLGSAFFLFIAAFSQLNIIPYAMNTLQISEVHGGYLFFGVAVGIALGAYSAGRICKKEVDLGLSCAALFAIGILYLSLPFLGGKLYTAVGVLISLGFFGGLFAVPLGSYIQAFSSSQMRGRVVACSNFLSFVGVLAASVCLLIFTSAFQVSAAGGFGLLGVLIIGVFFLFLRYLSVPFLNFCVRYLVHPFFDLHYMGYPFGDQGREERSILVSTDGQWKNIMLLLGESTKIQLFVVKKEKEFFDPLAKLFANITIVYFDDKTPLDPAVIHRKANTNSFFFKPVYFFTTRDAYKAFAKERYFERLSQEFQYNIRFFRVRSTKIFPTSLKTLLKREQKTFHFQTSRALSGVLQTVRD